MIKLYGPKTLVASLGMLSLAAGGAAAEGEGSTNFRQIDSFREIVLPGAYELTQNLRAQGDCIVISVNNVTLDLQGFAVIGDGSGRGITDGGSGQRGLRVSGGTVTRFAVAVDFNVSATVEVTDMLVIGNSGQEDPILCVADPDLFGFPSGIATGSGSRVHNNLVRDTVGMAIKVGSGSIVTNNVIRDTEDAGSTEREVSGICAFSGATVTGNAVTDNESLGIHASSGSTLAGNTVRDNGDGLRALSGSSISGNSTRSNSGVGIEAFCPSNLIGNTAILNGDNLVLDGSDCNSVNNLAPDT